MIRWVLSPESMTIEEVDVLQIGGIRYQDQKTERVFDEFELGLDKRDAIARRMNSLSSSIEYWELAAASPQTFSTAEEKALTREKLAKLREQLEKVRRFYMEFKE